MAANKCKECMDDAPYDYCCKVECDEHEFCRGCTAKSKHVVIECPYNKQVIQMAENKMAQVAAMFGKKLGEEFNVRYLNNIIKSKFTRSGFEENFLTSEWLVNGELLRLLLTGDAEVVDEKNDDFTE